jgi:hypothetical protein
VADWIDAATRAIAINPKDHHAHRLRALLHFMSQNAEYGMPELRQAHEMNWNCAVTMAWLGLYKGFHGDPEKGVPLVKTVQEHSPRDPARRSLLAALGFAQFAIHSYEAAVDAGRK